MDPIIIVAAIQALVNVFKDIKANQTEPTPQYLEAQKRMRKLQLELAETLGQE